MEDLTPVFKTLTTGNATLSIGSHREDGVHNVTVRLEHRECHECGDV